MKRALLLLIASLSLLASGCRPGLQPKEVVYSEIGGTSLSMDIYQPSANGTALRPAVVMFHGGAWRGLFIKDWGHEASLPSCPLCFLT